MRTQIFRRMRRAISTVEMAVALALIAIVVTTGGYYLSSSTSAELDQTADEIADPSELAQRFLQ